MRGLRLLSLSAAAFALHKRKAHRTSATRPPEDLDKDVAGQSNSRGRDAAKPSELPASGWKDILTRVKNEVSEDNVSIVAAGVAFYGLMALAPAIAALVSIYGMFASPASIQSHFSNLVGVMPEDARQLLLDQITRIATSSETNLSIAAAGALLLALLSAMKGSKALITAANIAYDERERRGFIKLNAAAFSLTVASVVFVIVALAFIAGFPVVVQQIPLPASVQTGISLLRWPVLGLLLILGLAGFYRYAANRHEPKWRWVTWGSVASTVLWIIGSILFSFYVSRFGSYNETYGSLGAVVILLMWFYLSAYVVLLGAELNSEMEHQTARDSTTGPSAPMGGRGAYVADTLGAPRDK